MSCVRSNARGGALLALAAAGAFIAGSADAQYFNCAPGTCHVVSGNVGDALASGPFLAGHVYLATGTLTIPFGQTLTIGAGVTVKFPSIAKLSVDGTLSANGTAGAPIVFTSIKDDVIADHNGDGAATVGEPGQWSRLDFNSSGASVLQHAHVRFAGSGSLAAFDLHNSNLTMSHCRTDSVLGPCLTLSTTSFPTVIDCVFNGGTKAATGVMLGAIAGFSGCTSSGQSIFTAPEITAHYGNPQGLSTIDVDDSFNSDGVIVVGTDLIVPAFTNMTIGAGVVLRMDGDRAFVCNGTLTVAGVLSAPVVFTSIHDDFYGGDVNRNGSATSAAAGQWQGISFGPVSLFSSASFVSVRCTGSSGMAAISLNQSNLSLTNVATDLTAGPGLDLGSTSSPTLVNCSFDNGTYAITNAPIGALSGFSGCTATGNTVSNTILVSNDQIPVSRTISAAGTLNGDGVIATAGDLFISGQGSLTLLAGMTIKFSPGKLFSISCGAQFLGTAAQPIVLTSIFDDEHGGDSNLDGPATQAAAGQWRGVSIYGPSSMPLLTFVRVRCTGYGAFPAIDLAGSTVQLISCTTALGAGACLFAGGAQFGSYSACSFDGGTKAATGLRFDSLPNFQNCTAAGNSVYDAPELTIATATNQIPIGPSFGFGGVVVIGAAPPTPTWTPVLLGGVIVKVAPGIMLTLQGGAVAATSPANPVVITSIFDDAYGGDTNLDGALTQAAPGQWGPLKLNGTNPTALTGGIFRAGGAGGVATILISTPAATSLADCRVELGSGAAVSITGSVPRPTLSRCAFDLCASPLTGIPVGAVKGIRDCTAAGNTATNSVRIAPGAPAANEAATVDRMNSLNGDGVFEASGFLGVAGGASLTIGRGVVLKSAASPLQLTAWINGTLNLLGTGAEPIVITSLADDDFGGDTNGDGPSTGSPGALAGIAYLAGSFGTAEHVLVRFGGSVTLGTACFSCVQPGVSLRSVRTEFGSAAGFQLSAPSGIYDNLVAFGNATHGVTCGGGVSLRHLTSAYNGGAGVNVTAAGTGTVVNSIVKFNGTGAFTGAAFAQIASTDAEGPPLGPGNFDLDPFFENGPLGLLGLLAGSSCAGAADAVADAGLFNDHVEGSRIADGDLTGSGAADLGAYERAPYRLTVTGRPWSGDALTIEVEGATPGIALVGFGSVVGAALFVPYGYAFLDASAFDSPLFVLPTGSSLTLPLPDISAFAGTPFALQALVFVATDPTRGGFSNVYRAVIDG